MRYLLLPLSVDLFSLLNDEPLRTCVLCACPNSRNLDGGGNELAELSLNVEAELRSLLVPLLTVPDREDDGFLSDDRDSLSDRRPYSPSLRGDGGIRERAGDCRLFVVVLPLLLSESQPSDFFLGCTSAALSSRPYSPSLRGTPLRCECVVLGGRGNELGGRLPDLCRPDDEPEAAALVLLAELAPLLVLPPSLTVVVTSAVAEPEAMIGPCTVDDDALSVDGTSCMRCCCELKPCFSSSNISPLSCRDTVAATEGCEETSVCRKPPDSNRPVPLADVTPANNGLGIFPFRGAMPGLENPGKQQRPR